MIHHFDDAMAYTACKLLPGEVETSPTRNYLIVLGRHKDRGRVGAKEQFVKVSLTDYTALCELVEAVLPKLDFSLNSDHALAGHALLEMLNRVGARLVYDSLVKGKGQDNGNGWR